MSLLFYDGFNNYTYLPLKWDEFTKNSQFSIKTNIGRKNDNAICVYSGYTNVTFDHLGKKFDTFQDTIILGFAYKKVKTDYGFIEVDFNLGESIQSKLKLFDKSIVWYKGDESFNYGINYSLQFNAWNYVEAKIKTHTTSGTVDVRINEKTIFSLSNISTATTINYIDRIRFRLRYISQTNEDYAYIDDLYIANVSGTVNNNFLGNCTVSSISPISQGTFSDFYLPATVSGVNNYTMVNESVYAQDTTTYSGTFLEYASGDDGYLFDETINDSSTLLPITISTGLHQTVVWFRFSGLNIPRRAKITKVNLYYYEDFRSGQYLYDNNVTFGFQKSGTPVSQITSLADFNSRTITDATLIFPVTYTNPLTQDYKESLQEIVNMDNWQEENNVVLLTLNKKVSGSGNTDVLKMRSYNYSNDPYSINSPKLYVEWQLPNDPSGTYLRINDINKKETYMLTVSGITNIFAIKHNVTAKRYLDRADTDDLALMPIIYNGVTTYSGSTKLNFKDTDYICLSRIDEKNPVSNNAWLLSDLQTLEFGIITTISG